MAVLKYDRILRYLITLQCNGPLRIGSAVGSKEEVLVHPVDNKPFVQASSITGALRSYYAGLEGSKANLLFGEPEKEKNGEEENESRWSRVKISDGIFTDNDTLKLELRPHVKISRETGSADAAAIQGTKKKAGQKFNLEYIGKGSEFSFTLDVYAEVDDHLEDEIMKILSGLKAEMVQFGGKKSSGAGNVTLKTLKFKEFNLRDANQRKQWINQEEDCAYQDYLEKVSSEVAKTYLYRVTVIGKTEGGIQVKGIAVSEFGKDAPDSENIRNAAREFIVPGSSFKGSVRSQMEKIAKYMNKAMLINDIFGCTGKGEKDSKSGNIYFHDTIIGDVEENDKAPITRRIHIDKFTGGVFNKGLFSEKNASGKLEFVVDIKPQNQPDASLGLLILAMRDLAAGLMSVGNGYSVGKGIIDVDKIVIEKYGQETPAVLNFKDNYTLSDSGNIVSSALAALKGVTGKDEE